MHERPLHVLRHLAELRAEQWLDRDSLARLQSRRLVRALEAAAKTVHYRLILGASNPRHLASDLCSIPLTSKEDLQKGAERFVTIGSRMATLHNAMTSGTTGLPLRICFDQETMEWRAAAALMTQLEFGRGPLDLFADISASQTLSVPLHQKIIFRKLSLSVFDDENRNFSILKNAKPDIIGWYPSVLSGIARLNDKGGRPLRLKSVFCGAEFLSKGYRKLISESFSCPVFNQYGCTEFAVIARECPEEHNMHISSSTCVVEIVDGRGKPLRSGTGRIAVTGLCNRSMPLVRYLTGDLGSWGTDCSCGRGSPVLRSIEGRVSALLVLPSGRVRSEASLRPKEELLGVRAYQIVQEKEDVFVFRFVPFSRGLSGTARNEAVRAIRECCLGEEIGVEFDEMKSLPKGRTGKTPRVVSRVGCGKRFSP